MADLFDALVARAMGTDVPLLPAPTPRFSAPIHEPRLVVVSTEDVAETPASGRTDVHTVAERSALAGPDRAVLRAGPGPLARPRDLVPPGTESPSSNALEAEPLSRDVQASATGPVTQTADQRLERRRTVPIHTPAPPDRVADRAALTASLPELEPATGHDARATAPNHVLAPTEELAMERVDIAPGDASQSPARTPMPIEVTVHIGSVVVRSAPVPAAASARPPARLPEPRMSLQEYLQQDARR